MIAAAMLTADHCIIQMQIALHFCILICRLAADTARSLHAGLQQESEVVVRTNGDGTVTVSENNMVIHLGLTMAVSFEPLDAEPRRLG